MDDFVEMKHPNLPDKVPVRVARSSFLRVWQKRGWVAAGAPEKPVEKQAEIPKPAPAAPRPTARLTSPTSPTPDAKE
jgi:hypothetical protein